MGDVKDECEAPGDSDELGDIGPETGVLILRLRRTPAVARW